MENFMETLQSLPEQVEILVFERLGKIKKVSVKIKLYQRQREDRTFPLTRKLRNVVISEYLGVFAAKQQIQTPASGITFSRKQVFFGIVNHTYFGILWECTGLIV